MLEVDEDVEHVLVYWERNVGNAGAISVCSSLSLVAQFVWCSSSRGRCLIIYYQTSLWLHRSEVLILKGDVRHAVF